MGPPLKPKTGLFSVRALLAVSLALNAALVFRPILPEEAALGEVSPPEPPRLSRSEEDDGRAIDLDHGDPTMYEAYWRRTGKAARVVVSGWQSVSYFSDPKNLCWFLDPDLGAAVIRLHQVVGNAVTHGRHIVVGTGSSQLLLAAFFALSPPDAARPVDVVAAAPYYSAYPTMTDFLESGLYKWGGDARSFDRRGPYIEIVTSPNNPDGSRREGVVKRSGGVLIHDFAYYWPQYTPITSPADHDLMLFTVSKSTGHAGVRIGWALVKNREVAERMTKFIELNTIGVSKDSQLRAAKILQAVSRRCEVGGRGRIEGGNFFEFGRSRMEERWSRLRAAVERSGRFGLPDLSSDFCRFTNRTVGVVPAFAWLKCLGGPDMDCEGFLRRCNIMVRGGRHFGEGPEYVRVSMLDRDENFERFIGRIDRMTQDG